MKSSVYLSCALLLCTAILPAAAQEANPDSLYTALVERVKAGDFSVDFQKLRDTYAETSYYHPLIEPTGEVSMAEAYGANNDEKAIEEAQKVLAERYVHTNAHFICAESYLALGDTARAIFHKKVLEHLAQSIMESGDGRSKATAMHVLTVEEQFTVMVVMGYDPKKGAKWEPSHENGREYESGLFINRKTGEEAMFHFDITRPIMRVMQENEEQE